MDNVNWNEIVQALLKRYSQVELNKLTNVSQSTISSLSRGIEMPYLSYKNGHSLLQAYENMKNEE